MTTNTAAAEITVTTAAGDTETLPVVGGRSPAG